MTLLIATRNLKDSTAECSWGDQLGSAVTVLDALKSHHQEVYNPEGARLARQADALLREQQASCSAPPPAKEQSPQP